MDFSKPRDYTKPQLMQNGDLVVIYESHTSLDHFYLQENTIFNNKFGSFPHNDMIGKPFGSKINSRTSQGWIYVLKPTPELWSSAVHTRTQIVNELDSSVVVLHLDVSPGDVVVESGTGSGCMTLNLARAVSPNGHVFTFEYNGVRAATAREEFDRLGVGKLVTVQHKDVCGKFEAEDVVDRGGFPNVADKQADAVFLDLPEPWLALDHALRVLKPGRTVCCYSPCMEQVVKTCEKLRELKFNSIRMMEVRQRPYDARVADMETIDLGLGSDEAEMMNNRSVRDKNCIYQTNKPKQNVVPVFVSREEQRAQAAAAGASLTVPSVSTGTEEGSSNEKNDEENGEDEEEQGEDDEDDAEEKSGSRQFKRRKIQYKKGEEVEQVNSKPDQEVQHVLYEQNDMTDAQFEILKNRIRNRPQTNVNGSYEMHVARSLNSMKGHTAFLTFAVCPLLQDKKK